MGDRENFYILLELGYDPPVTDAETIRAALQRKKQEWTRQQDNPSKRNQALTNLGLAEEIEKVMGDPELRAKEVEGAKALRAEMLRQFEAELRVLEGKGHILPREVGAIIMKYKQYGVDREKLVETARCPISEKPVAKAEDEDKGEVLDRITAKNIQRNLALLGFSDLYEFLGEPQYSSVKKLRQSAEPVRKTAANAGSKNSTATITQELAGVCTQLFADFASKQKYDRFLKVGRHPALSEMIDQEFNRAGVIGSESLLRLVNFGVERYGLKVLEAEDIIRRYCAAYEVPVGEKSRLVTCPACASQNDSDSAVCSACAAPLRGECPQCGTAFDHGPAVCPACGFAIGSMVKALESMNDAENALIENNWSTARRCLDYAEKYWPGHPKLETLNKRALLIEERYATYVENIADCVSHNQYYAAMDLVREAEGRRIPLPQSAVEHVEKVVAEVEAEIAGLKEKGEPSFEEIQHLAETVSDSMELTHLMRRYPPAPPGRLISALGGRGVRLTWSVSESPGMKEYVVVRRQDDAPLTAYDGDILYEGPANSFLDRTAKALTEYHYAVYTRRGGAYSSTAATAKPVLLVPEIENLRILPTDMGAQLSWDYNPAFKEVEIWRKLGGDKPNAPGEGVQMDGVRLDGFTDKRMKNGVDYWYYICAVYKVGGRRIRSRGVCDSVMPRQMLAPIDSLIIARTDDEPDEYVASWQGSHYNDVLLFSSQRKPPFRKGELVLLADLIEEYRKLELDAKQPESARFRFSWNGGLYIFPAAVTGQYATIGEVRYQANVQDVQNPTYDIVEGDIFLNMKWPAGLSEIVVAYRFDDFAQQPDEPGAGVLHYTKEQYDYDAGVRIQDPEPAVYYVTVFSAFTTPDRRKVYSPGVNILVNNLSQVEVFFKFSRTKKLFSSVSTITATLSSADSFQMPRAVIIGKVGRLPLSKNDGVPLFEIDKETRVGGSVVYEYRTSSLPDNLYIRLFLHDDDMYEKLRLLSLGGMHIT